MYLTGVDDVEPVATITASRSKQQALRARRIVHWLPTRRGRRTMGVLTVHPAYCSFDPAILNFISLFRRRHATV